MSIIVDDYEPRVDVSLTMAAPPSSSMLDSFSYSPDRTADNIVVETTSTIRGSPGNFAGGGGGGGAGEKEQGGGGGGGGNEGGEVVRLVSPAASPVAGSTSAARCGSSGGSSNGTITSATATEEGASCFTDAAVAAPAPVGKATTTTTITTRRATTREGTMTRVFRRYDRFDANPVPVFPFDGNNNNNNFAGLVTSDENENRENRENCHRPNRHHRRRDSDIPWDEQQQQQPLAQQQQQQPSGTIDEDCRNNTTITTSDTMNLPPASAPAPAAAAAVSPPAQTSGGSGEEEEEEEEEGDATKAAATTTTTATDEEEEGTARYHADGEEDAGNKDGGLNDTMTTITGDEYECDDAAHPPWLRQRRQGVGGRHRPAGDGRRRPFTTPKGAGEGKENHLRGGNRTAAASGRRKKQSAMMPLLRPDVRVLMANNKVFFHSSAILSYASPVLCRHLVWRRRAKTAAARAGGGNGRAADPTTTAAGGGNVAGMYELRFNHRPALEWKWLEPFLQPHSRVSATVTPIHVVHLLPWFLELELDVLVDRCDRILHSSLTRQTTAVPAADPTLPTAATAAAGVAFAASSWSGAKVRTSRDIYDLLLLSKIVLHCQKRHHRQQRATATGAGGDELLPPPQQGGGGSNDAQDETVSSGSQVWLLERTGQAVMQQWNDLWNNSPHLLLAKPSKSGLNHNDDYDEGFDPATTSADDPMNSSCCSDILYGLDLLRSFVVDVLAELPERERHKLWLAMIKFLPPDLDVFSFDSNHQSDLLHNPLFPYLLREGLSKHGKPAPRKDAEREERRLVAASSRTNTGGTCTGDFDEVLPNNYKCNESSEEWGQEVRLLDEVLRKQRQEKQQEEQEQRAQPSLLYQEWQESFQEWWRYWSSGGDEGHDDPFLLSSNGFSRSPAPANMSGRSSNKNSTPCPDTLCPTNANKTALGSATGGMVDLLMATVTARPLPPPPIALPTSRSEWLENIWQHLQQPILPALPPHHQQNFDHHHHHQQQQQQQVDHSGKRPYPPATGMSSSPPPPPPRRGRSKSPAKKNAPKQSSPRRDVNDSRNTSFTSSSSLGFSTATESYYSSVGGGSGGGGRGRRKNRSRSVRWRRGYLNNSASFTEEDLTCEEVGMTTMDESTEYYTTEEGTSTADEGGGLPGRGSRDNSREEEEGGLIYDHAEGILVSPKSSQRKFYC